MLGEAIVPDDTDGLNCDDAMDNDCPSSLGGPSVLVVILSLSDMVLFGCNDRQFCLSLNAITKTERSKGNVLPRCNRI